MIVVWMFFFSSSHHKFFVYFLLWHEVTRETIGVLELFWCLDKKKTLSIPNTEKGSCDKMDFNLFKYFIGAIFGLAFCMSFVLNSLVILAVVKDPLKKLRKMFNFLLIHLCACDLAASLICFPMTSDIIWFIQIRRSETIPYFEPGFILGHPDSKRRIFYIGMSVFRPIQSDNRPDRLPTECFNKTFFILHRNRLDASFDNHHFIFPRQATNSNYQYNDQS